MTIERTDSGNSNFVMLTQLLDSELDERDNAAHTVCKQYNKSDTIKYVVLAYDTDKAVGCGAIRKYSEDTIEIKRMFVLDEYRKKGVASCILNELEKWSKELGSEFCILETGRKFPDAIKLYEKNGYSNIPNYGQYEHIESSICFQKKISLSNNV
ncbi:GNAT family N-acetyltransferase [Dysgonomonas sp.]